MGAQFSHCQRRRMHSAAAEPDEEPETLNELQKQRLRRRVYSAAEHHYLRVVVLKRTVRSIVALLRIRKNWARTGALLQQHAVNFKHLQRVGGVLRRR
jgi:non-ribosomal peptide synthetase component F